MYAEGVRKFQPRVALWQPWGIDACGFLRNSERVAMTTGLSAQPFQGLRLL